MKHEAPGQNASKAKPSVLLASALFHVKHEQGHVSTILKNFQKSASACLLLQLIHIKHLGQCLNIYSYIVQNSGVVKF